LAGRLRAALAPLGDLARLLGPAPAPFSKLRSLYRFHMQAQAADGALLRRAVREATAGLQAPDDVQWIVDVDPLEMM
jgi:primosomal protein N' (replication factor Y)